LALMKVRFCRGHVPYAVLFAVAAALRLGFAIFARTYAAADWYTSYKVVAENIVLNLCVSQSDPATGLCVPHWGGNQLPGYPLFIAAAWSLFGRSEAAVLVCQALAASAAVVWLARAVEALTRDRRIALLAGAVLAISPVAVGWSRALLTEELALATTMWVLAELLLSLAHGRFRTWPLGLALASAVFVRYDGVLLCVPVALCAFLIYSPWKAILSGASVAAVLLLPLAAWSARSVYEGLPFPPSTNAVRDQGPAGDTMPIPIGFRRYGMTWIVTPTDAYAYTLFGYATSYSRVRVPERAFESKAEAARVHSLLDALKAHEGKPIPKDIDDAFGKLADQRMAAEPFRVWLWLPIMRIAMMWINPTYGWGLPLEFPTSQAALDMERTIRQSGPFGVAKLVIEHPVIAAGKMIANGYLVLLIAAFLALPFFWSRLDRNARLVTAIAAVYVAARSVFFAEMAYLESRYVVECIPAMEVAVILAYVCVFRPRNGGMPRWVGRLLSNRA
jgi:Dolichyl-phosphate-mannose-protein mannosyltransferase